MLRGFVTKCDVLWEAGCDENIANTMVFIRFSVLMKFGFWVSFSRFLVSFWEVFGVPGDTFCDFEGAGKRLEILWFLVIPWAPYELRQRGPVRGSGRL